MTKLDIINKKLELRNQCEELIKNGESESRKLNSVETAKLDELRKMMADCDAQIAEIDKNLEEEKRVADIELKNKVNNDIKMENTKKFSIVDEIRSRIENPANGLDFQVKINGNAETRKYDVTGGKETGDVTVPEELDDLLTPLYDNVVLSNFTFLTGLHGNISIPSMEGNQVAWADENGEAEFTDSSITAVKMSPKRLTAQCYISKQLLIQSASNIEAVVRADIQKALTDKLQKTLLGDGAGTSNKPAGIFKDASALTGGVSFANVVKVEKEIEEANVNATGYIINPSVKATARQAVKAQGQGGFLFEGGQLDGMPTAVTNACKGILYGDLKEFIIGQWDNVEITIDPYTAASKGMIRLVINSYWDAIKRRPEAIKAYKVA